MDKKASKMIKDKTHKIHFKSLSLGAKKKDFNYNKPPMVKVN